jgi:hypothetical protein
MGSSYVCESVMLSSKFHQLFPQLVGRFKVYQDAPRDIEGLRELADARANLEDVRLEVFEEAKGELRELRALRVRDPQAYAASMRDQSRPPLQDQALGVYP